MSYTEAIVKFIAENIEVCLKTSNGFSIIYSMSD